MIFGLCILHKVCMKLKSIMSRLLDKSCSIMIYFIWLFDTILYE